MNHLKEVKQMREKGMKWFEISTVVGIPPGHLHNLITKPEVFPMSDKMKSRIENGLKVKS